VKGRFFDRLDAKLNQLARFDSNELVSVDLQAMATALFRGQEETVRCQTCAPRPKVLGAMLRVARRRVFVTFVLGQNRPIGAVTLCRFDLD
jgi:hypothetical protein